MELRVLVGLLLVPDGREKDGSGVTRPFQGDAHISLGTVLQSVNLILSGPLDITQPQTVSLGFFCLLSLLCSLVVYHVLSPRLPEMLDQDRRGTATLRFDRSYFLQ